MSATREKRQAAERAGRLAEWLAALAYVVRGYEIVARRFKAPAGEIDLIARRGHTLVLVEVKKRADADDAVFAVGSRNRRRLEQAGRLFLARRPAFAAFAVRYDIAAVTGFSVRIVKDAWRDPT